MSILISAKAGCAIKPPTSSRLRGAMVKHTLFVRKNLKTNLEYYEIVILHSDKPLPEIIKEIFP